MKKADTAAAPEAAKVEDPAAAADAAAEAPKVNFKLLSSVHSFGIVMPTFARWSWFFLLSASIVLHCTCTSCCTAHARVFARLCLCTSVGLTARFKSMHALVRACVRACEFLRKLVCACS